MGKDIPNERLVPYHISKNTKNIERLWNLNYKLNFFIRLSRDCHDMFNNSAAFDLLFPDFSSALSNNLRSAISRSNVSCSGDETFNTSL